MSDDHLHSAARALSAILAARHPEHSFVVEVRERQLGDTAGSLGTAPADGDDPGAVNQDPHPIRERHPRPAAAGAPDDHPLEKSA